VADQLVTSHFPNARFLFSPTVLEAAMAVRSSKADAAAVTEPFSFIDGSRQVVGLDVEIAARSGGISALVRAPSGAAAAVDFGQSTTDRDHGDCLGRDPLRAKVVSTRNGHDMLSLTPSPRQPYTATPANAAPIQFYGGTT
jgi:hypothetical protein